MSVQNPLLKMTQPSVPETWDWKDWENAKKYYLPLKFWGFAFQALSAVGTVFTAYQASQLYFSAKVILSTSLAVKGIGFIALGILGFKLHEFAARHIKGLTKEWFLSLYHVHFGKDLETMKPDAKAAEQGEAGKKVFGKKLANSLTIMIETLIISSLWSSSKAKKEAAKV